MEGYNCLDYLGLCISNFRMDQSIGDEESMVVECLGNMFDYGVEVLEFIIDVDSVVYRVVEIFYRDGRFNIRFIYFFDIRYVVDN